MSVRYWRISQCLSVYLITQEETEIRCFGKPDGGIEKRTGEQGNQV